MILFAKFKYPIANNSSKSCMNQLLPLKGFFDIIFLIYSREWTFTSVRSRKSSSSSKMSSLNNSKDSSPGASNGGSSGNKKGFFTKQVFFTVLITNLVSFLVGAGIG